MRIIVFLLCFFSLCAAQNLNISDTTVSVSAVSDEKIFYPRDIIIPLSLITAGAVIAVSGLDQKIESKMLVNRGPQYRFDDFQQYFPHLTLYGFSILGAEVKHNYGERTLLLGTSGVFVLSAVAAKHIIKHPRPNSGTKNSFPSGHTATAFWGAELVRREYPVWAGVTAYTIAAGVGFMRIYNGRHWFGDVVAGAGFGILSVSAAYWLLPVEKQILQKRKRKNFVLLNPYFDGEDAGLFLTLSM